MRSDNEAVVVNLDIEPVEKPGSGPLDRPDPQGVAAPPMAGDPAVPAPGRRRSPRPRPRRTGPRRRRRAWRGRRAGRRPARRAQAGSSSSCAAAAASFRPVQSLLQELRRDRRAGGDVDQRHVGRPGSPCGRPARSAGGRGSRPPSGSRPGQLGRHGAAAGERHACAAAMASSLRRLALDHVRRGAASRRRGPCTSSATVRRPARPACRSGRSASSRSAASSNGRHQRSISPGRLPGSTSRIGSSGPASIAARSRAAVGAGEVAAQRRVADEGGGQPRALEIGRLEAVDGQQMVHRPGQHPRAAGPRRPDLRGDVLDERQARGARAAAARATRKVKPQESISTATSGRSATARRDGVLDRSPSARGAAATISNEADDRQARRCRTGSRRPRAAIAAPPTPTKRTPFAQPRASAPAPGRRPGRRREASPRHQHHLQRPVRSRRPGRHADDEQARARRPADHRLAVDHQHLASLADDAGQARRGRAASMVARPMVGRSTRSSWIGLGALASTPRRRPGAPRKRWRQLGDAPQHGVGALLRLDRQHQAVADHRALADVERADRAGDLASPWRCRPGAPRAAHGAPSGPAGRVSPPITSCAPSIGKAFLLEPVHQEAQQARRRPCARPRRAPGSAARPRRSGFRAAKSGRRHVAGEADRLAAGASWRAARCGRSPRCRRPRPERVQRRIGEAPQAHDEDGPPGCWQCSASASGRPPPPAIRPSLRNARPSDLPARHAAAGWARRG